MATRYRKDITSSDILLLARFASALNKVCINTYSPVFELGVVSMLLPFWYATGETWKVSSYKYVEQEAIGLSRNGMIQVCRDYMRVPVADMLELLHKLSIVAVVGGTYVDDKPKYRQPFSGIPRDEVEWGGIVQFVPAGFIIEKRRAIGGFKERG